MTTLTATFARLQDQTWGIRINGLRPVEGASVTVAKKDGSTKSATIARVLWHGTAKDGKEASLCTIVEERSSAPRRQRMGSGHGYASSVPGYSSYCTDNGSCRCYDCAS